MIQSIILAVADIKLSQHDVLQTCVEDIRLVAVRLDLRRTSKNQALNIWLVVSDEVLGCQFADLAHVVVALFLSNTRETKGGLTTTTVLFGKLHVHPLQNLLVVALESSVQDTVTVHNDKAKLFVVIQDLAQWLRVESGLATIREGVDGLERLNINRDFLFSLAVANLNNTAKQDQATVRDRFVEFKL